MAVFFPAESFRFTLGQPRTFNTSAIIERSFCADCGTSLMMRYVAGEFTTTRSVFVGSLDHPASIDSPGHHFGVESHLPGWISLEDGVPQLVAEDTPWLTDAWASVNNEGGND